MDIYTLQVFPIPPKRDFGTEDRDLLPILPLCCVNNIDTNIKIKA